MVKHTYCLSVFDQFVWLALKGLTTTFFLNLFRGEVKININSSKKKKKKKIGKIKIKWNIGLKWVVFSTFISLFPVI